MEITGDYRILASRQQVWEALNDPEILKQAIPGCEQLEKISDTEFAARVTLKIGPVKSKFNTQLSLTDLKPPTSYTLVGEGKGGAAGFARGTADVSLEEDGDATVLHYKADFKVGGKLAQIGSRVVAGASRKTANEFFSNFAAIMNRPEEAPAAAAPPTPAPAEAPKPISPMVWVAIAVVALIVLWLIFD